MKVPVIKADSIKSLSPDVIVPKVLAVDIETYNPHGKAIDMEKNPILMIALYGKDFRKVLTWKKFRTGDKMIEFVESEADMLKRFRDIIDELGPDMISGYYSDGFDLPYIKRRAKKHKVRLDVGLDNSELRISGRSKLTAHITGIFHMDIFKFIRRAFATILKTDSYSLDAVSEELLGEKKQEVELSNLAEAWDKGTGQLHDFCTYNLQDAKLTYDLTMKVLPNLIEFVRLTGLPPEDLHRMGFSQLVEWYIIRQSISYKELILSRPHYDDVSARRRLSFAGAFVYEPKPGL